MAVGKFSPTVVAAYQKNQDWWKPADEFNQYDADGFDSYGYDKNDRDRAGVQEYVYMFGEHVGDDYLYLEYGRVLDQWGVDENGQPKKVR